MSSVQESAEKKNVVSGETASDQSQINTPELLRSCQVNVTRVATAVNSGSRLSSSLSKQDRRSVRLQEREELVELNDRLASYIETVRSLETENVHLRTVLENYNNVQDSEIGKMKEMYDKELAIVRKSLDDVATERARHEIDLNRYRSKAQEAERELAGTESDIRELKARISALEEEMSQLRMQNSNLASEIEKHVHDLTKIRSSNSELSMKLEKVRKQLESETLGRVEAENRSITLTEELEFLRDVSEHEINKVKKAAAEVANLSARVESVGADERAMNDSLMRQHLQEIRQETEEKIEQMRIEIDSNYRKKLEDLEQRISHSTSITQNQKTELDHCRRRICELCTDRDHLNARLTNRELSLNEAEDRNQREREQAERQLAELEQSLVRSQKEYQTLNDDYNELMDLKVTLDQEIETYRRLVESEEERLHISNRKRRRVGDVDIAGSNIAAPLGCGDEGSQLPTKQASVRFSTSSQHVGPIAIVDVTDRNPGDAIALKNTSVRPVSIGGWVLIRKCTAANDTLSDGLVVEHKFPRNTIIQPDEEIRVYSANAENALHNPATGSFVMTRGKCWPSPTKEYAKLTTTLLDLDHEEMAIKENMQISSDEEEVVSSRISNAGPSRGTQEEKPHSGGRASGVTSKLFGLF